MSETRASRRPPAQLAVSTGTPTPIAQDGDADVAVVVDETEVVPPEPSAVGKDQGSGISACELNVLFIIV